MPKRTSFHKPLTGRVALVAGATRGAGRGIARALGEGGATVYCIGRSVKGKPSPYGRPETIDETAAMIKAAGGTATALRVDHTNEAAVKALFRRIMRAHKRIDVVVDSGMDRSLPHGRRPGDPVVDDACGADQKVQNKDPDSLVTTRTSA